MRISVTHTQLLQHLSSPILRFDISLTATSVWATVVGAEPSESELTMDQRSPSTYLFFNLCDGDMTQKITKAKKNFKTENHTRASPL